MLLPYAILNSVISIYAYYMVISQIYTLFSTIILHYVYVVQLCLQPYSLITNGMEEMVSSDF